MKLVLTLAVSLLAGTAFAQTSFSSGSSGGSGGGSVGRSGGGSTGASMSAGGELGSGDSADSRGLVGLGTGDAATGNTGDLATDPVADPADSGPGATAVGTETDLGADGDADGDLAGDADSGVNADADVDVTTSGAAAGDEVDPGVITSVSEVPPAIVEEANDLGAFDGGPLDDDAAVEADGLAADEDGEAGEGVGGDVRPRTIRVDAAGQSEAR